MRWRTLAAGLGIPLLLIVYAILVVTVNGWLPAHWVIDLVFYAVAGIVWIFPAAAVVRWAKRDPEPEQVL